MKRIFAGACILLIIASCVQGCNTAGGQNAGLTAIRTLLEAANTFTSAYLAGVAAGASDGDLSKADLDAAIEGARAAALQYCTTHGIDALASIQRDLLDGILEAMERDAEKVRTSQTTAATP